MNGTERRAALLQLIKSSRKPLSGDLLAKELGVSRQVIVQDIALLRAADCDILSTNRGYTINTPATVSRIFQVYHNDSDTEAELNAIVDCGGYVEDVFVEHALYGRLCARLDVGNRRQVKQFIRNLENGTSSPLKNITKGYHFHTVHADSEETLQEIEDTLRALGFLIQT